MKIRIKEIQQVEIRVSQKIKGSKEVKLRVSLDSEQDIVYRCIIVNSVT